MSAALLSCGASPAAGSQVEHRPSIFAPDTGQKAAVQGRQQLLDQPRFFKQRAKLSGSLLPVDALDLLPDAHVIRPPVVTGKMGQHARAQIRALADIQRHVVFAIKQISAGRLGNGI